MVKSFIEEDVEQPESYTPVPPERLFDDEFDSNDLSDEENKSLTRSQLSVKIMRSSMKLLAKGDTIDR